MVCVSVRFIISYSTEGNPPVDIFPGNELYKDDFIWDKGVFEVSTKLAQ